MDKPTSPRRPNLPVLLAVLGITLATLLLSLGCGRLFVPKHGIEFTAIVDTNGLSADSNRPAVLAQTVEVMRKRMDKLGFAGVTVQPTNGNELVIRLPGLTDANKTNAVRLIERSGLLEFCLVHEENDELIKEGITPPAYELHKRMETLRDGTQRLEQLLVRKKASLGGSCIKNAIVTRGSLGDPEIDFTLTADSTSAFGELTRENVGRRLAIVLDGRVYSAPVIQSPIETGRGQITGDFRVPEAFELANVLENPLPVRLKVVSQAQF